MNKTTLLLTSDQTSLLKLQQFVENVCDHFNIQNTYFGNILICLNEAFANAVKHGNQNDSAKIVTLEMKNENTELSFTITHQGNVFNYEELVSKISPDETKGLFLIKTLSDKFEFQNEGKTIFIQFNITPIEPEFKRKRSQILSGSVTQIDIKKKLHQTQKH